MSTDALLMSKKIPLSLPYSTVKQKINPKLVFSIKMLRYCTRYGTVLPYGTSRMMKNYFIRLFCNDDCLLQFRNSRTIPYGTTYVVHVQYSIKSISLYLYRTEIGYYGTVRLRENSSQSHFCSVRYFCGRGNDTYRYVP